MIWHEKNSVSRLIIFTEGEKVSWITSVQKEILSSMSLSGIQFFSKTIEICKSRDDAFSSVIMWCLLSVNNLISVEGRYNICRSSFKNVLPEHQYKLRPPSNSNRKVFVKECKRSVDEMELYTVKEFYNTMFNGVDNSYCTKWCPEAGEYQLRFEDAFVEAYGSSCVC